MTTPATTATECPMCCSRGAHVSWCPRLLSDPVVSPRVGQYLAAAARVGVNVYRARDIAEDVFLLDPDGHVSATTAAEAWCHRLACEMFDGGDEFDGFRSELYAAV